MSNYKNILKKTFLIAVCYCLSTNNTFADFKDVPKDHPNYEAINYVQEQQIVQGYENGTFRPDKKINRAEFTKIIIESSVETRLIASLQDCFTDVQNQWFAKYICLAKNKEIINGYSDETFKPNQNISFVEAAKIIVKAFGYEVKEDKGRDLF